MKGRGAEALQSVALTSAQPTQETLLIRVSLPPVVAYCMASMLRNSFLSVAWWWPGALLLRGEKEVDLTTSSAPLCPGALDVCLKGWGRRAGSQGAGKGRVWV